MTQFFVVSIVLKMLEDPANLFVVDLASLTLVQVAACLFLGCFGALPVNTNTNTPPFSGSSGSGIISTEDTILNRTSFLKMIDSRIGINRFTEILNKPIVARTMHKAVAQSYASLFISPDFFQFHQKQVKAIQSGMFEVYMGAGGVSTGNMGDSMQQQLIEMQKEKIAQLEAQLSRAQNGSDVAMNGSHHADVLSIVPCC